MSGELQRRRQDDVDNVATMYASCQGGPPRPPPSFGTAGWWACMVSDKLRKYEAAMRRHDENAFASPEDLTYSPEYASVPEDPPEALDRLDGGSERSSEDVEGRTHAEATDDMDEGADPKETRRTTGPAADLMNLRCGTLPSGASVEDVHTPPAKAYGRSAEARYWREFASLPRESWPDIEGDRIDGAVVESWKVRAEPALVAAQETDRCLVETSPKKDKFDFKLEGAVRPTVTIVRSFRHDCG
ncbi:hypothetical protein N9L68_00100 [bacterium]|nr:hypothetical protein [bacterium]